MNITFKQLQAFLEVARQGSFTAAAKQLLVSQPALTVTIRDLENDLGVRLLDRTTRRVRLTQEGAGFLPTVEQLLRDVEAAVDDIREVAERRRGQVRLACLPSVASGVLPPILAEYAESYPSIAVHLHDANASAVQTRVKNREVDFGIGSHWAHDEDLLFTPLFEDRFYLVCRDDHPLAVSDEPIPWSELADWVFLGLAPDTGIRPLLNKVSDLPPSVQRPLYEVSNMSALDGLLAAGIGATVLPRLAVPQTLKVNYVVRPMIEPELHRQICFIQMHGRSLSPAAQSLFDMTQRKSTHDKALEFKINKNII